MRHVKGAIITSLAAGAVVTTAAYMMTAKKSRAAKTVKRKANKAMHTVGSVIENIGYMMK